MKNLIALSEKITAKKSRRLSSFTWKGIDKNGCRVQGTSLGYSTLNIRAELKRQDIHLFKLKRKRKPTFQLRSRIQSADLIAISRQLATLFASGIPAVTALDVISRLQHKLSLQLLIQEIRDDVTTGTTLSNAFAKHPRHFSKLFTNMLRAGEQSGKVDMVLTRLCETMEKTQSLTNHINKAMYYPITVSSITVLVTFLLMAYVIPQFEKMFSSFGATLPVFTLFIINLAHICQRLGLAIIATIVFVCRLLMHYKHKSSYLSYAVDSCTLKLPIIGNIISKSIIVRVSRILSMTLSAGIPILEALTTAGTISNNSIYNKALRRIKEKVEVGMQLHAAMKITMLFPDLVIQMIAVGEESSSLPIMLERIALFYETELDHDIDSLSSFIEPFMILFLGGIIGSFVLALYLPIFRLSSIM